MENHVMVKLQRLLDSLSTEEQQRIFYTLDYVVEYFVGERRIPTLSMQGFSKELQQLNDIGAITSTIESWRGNSYEHLSLKQDIDSSIKKLLNEKYYPIYNTEAVTQKIQVAVKNSPPLALAKMWGMINEHRITEYSLNNWSDDTKEVELLAEKLAIAGLGYIVGYHSSSWGSYYKEIIFRNRPTDVREFFLATIGEEIKKTLSSLPSTEKWCLYVKHIYPQTDERFLLKNATASRLPLQIKQAFPKTSIDLAKLGKNGDLIINEQKEKQAKDLKSLSHRDPVIVATLGTLFTTAHEEKNYRKIDSQTMNKLFETVADTQTFNSYLSYLKSFSLVLETQTGDYIIPHSVWEALTDEIKGEAREIKFFDNAFDGKAFLEETMSKAISSIKIWDPYVKSRTFAILEKEVDPKVLIEILTSEKEAEKELRNLINKDKVHKVCRLQAKIIFYASNPREKRPWHDRYLIIDNETVWHLGPSMDDAGSKPHESATLFSSQLGARIIEAFNYNLAKSKEEWRKDGYEVNEIRGAA